MQKKYHPPRWIDRMLERVCNPYLLEEIQGDLHELYREWRTAGELALSFPHYQILSVFCY